MRELLVYGGIFDFQAASFILNVERVPVNLGIKLRLNTPGGDPDAMWGMIAKFREFKGEKLTHVDGQAQSAGFFFLLFSQKNQALKQSTLMVHRATSFFEDEIPEVKEQVRKRNEDLREAFEAKIDIPEFEKIAGITVERLFDTDEEPIDVLMTAREGEQIGLIQEVIDLSPNELVSLNQSLIAAHATPVNIEEQKTDSPMTLQDLKTKHPEVYNEIFTEGKTAGIKFEQDRAGAWMQFVEVDPEAVRKGIESDDPPSMTVMSKMAIKAASATASVDDDADDDVEGETPDEKKARIEAKKKEDKKEIETSSQSELNTEETKKPDDKSSENGEKVSDFEAASRKVLNLSADKKN